MKTLSQFIAENNGYGEADIHKHFTKMGMTKSDLGYTAKPGTKRHEIHQALLKHGYELNTHYKSDGARIPNPSSYSKESVGGGATATIHERPGKPIFVGYNRYRSYD